MDVSENSNAVHLAVVYRPPGSSSPFKLFLDEFSNVLDDYLFKHASLVISGDFNIHVGTNSSDARCFSDVLNAYGLEQHIQQPTHVRGHILDLLISRKEIDTIGLSDVDVVNGISDHSAITCNLHTPSQQTCRKSVVSRNIQSIHPVRFIEDLEDASLMEKCTVSNADLAVSNYNSIIMSALNSHAPVQQRSVTIRSNTKWYTKKITDEKLRRRQLERKWRSSKLEIHRQLYRQQCQRVQSLIRAAKIEYNSKRIEDCSGDSKRLFRVASDLMNRKQKSPLPTHASAAVLAFRFNKFFSSKIEAIRASLPDTIPPLMTLQTTAVLDTLTPASVDEVRKIISRSPAKSCELDPIPTDLLKKCKSTIVPAITRIINISLDTGVVPEDLKKAIVRPTLKKSGMDADSLQSYRPISNLPYLSKVLERVAFSRLSDHLHDNSLLDSHQSAYRPNHSVETLLTNLTDDVLQQMDNGNVTALVLLDMSSAFDTVDHHILLDQLCSLGVSGTAMQWFKSYLSNRCQCVGIGDAKSEDSHLAYGVPQGSVGGPLLFSIYLQPVGNIIKTHNIKYHCYADDIQLYVSFPPTRTTMLSAAKQLEACIKDINTWMDSTGLKLNHLKSEVIVLGSKQMLGKVDMKEFHIQVGNNIIYPATKTRNLGVIFDTNMSFNDHVSHVSRSIRYQLRNLSFVRKYLSRSATEQLVHALISSRLDFCNSLFLSLSQQQLTKLQRLQNSAARLVTLTKKACHITPVLHSLHWLPVEKRITFKIMLLVYHIVHGSSPLYLQNSIHAYQPPRRLRSSDSSLLQVPRCRHSWGDHSFSYAGPALWNSLPLLLRQASSVSSFKQLLKTYLFTFVHITPVLKELHWLPVKQRLKNKILSLVFKL